MFELDSGDWSPNATIFWPRIENKSQSGVLRLLRTALQSQSLKTISEIAGQNKLRPHELINGKKELLENASNVFDKELRPKLAAESDPQKRFYLPVGSRNFYVIKRLVFKYVLPKKHS